MSDPEQASVALGLNWHIGRFRFRLWRYRWRIGFEWSNGMRGRYYFFPPMKLPPASVVVIEDGSFPCNCHVSIAENAAKKWRGWP